MDCCLTTRTSQMVATSAVYKNQDINSVLFWVWVWNSWSLKFIFIKVISQKIVTGVEEKEKKEKKRKKKIVLWWGSPSKQPNVIVPWWWSPSKRSKNTRSMVMVTTKTILKWSNFVELWGESLSARGNMNSKRFRRWNKRRIKNQKSKWPYIQLGRGKLEYL